MINFLLTTEIIPLCLRIMESGSELSKTVSIYLIQGLHRLEKYMFIEGFLEKSLKGGVPNLPTHGFS